MMRQVPRWMEYLPTVAFCAVSVWNQRTITGMLEAALPRLGDLEMIAGWVALLLTLVHLWLCAVLSGGMVIAGRALLGDMGPRWSATARVVARAHVPLIVWALVVAWKLNSLPGGASENDLMTLLGTVASTRLYAYAAATLWLLLDAPAVFELGVWRAGVVVGTTLVATIVAVVAMNIGLRAVST
jgi:hypothetical protein